MQAVLNTVFSQLGCRGVSNKAKKLSRYLKKVNFSTIKDLHDNYLSYIITNKKHYLVLQDPMYSVEAKLAIHWHEEKQKVVKYFLGDIYFYWVYTLQAGSYCALY